jgi:alanine dehydrogenase
MQGRHFVTGLLTLHLEHLLEDGVATEDDSIGSDDMTGGGAIREGRNCSARLMIELMAEEADVALVFKSVRKLRDSLSVWLMTVKCVRTVFSSSSEKELAEVVEGAVKLVGAIKVGGAERDEGPDLLCDGMEQLT